MHKRREAIEISAIWLISVAAFKLAFLCGNRLSPLIDWLQIKNDFDWCKYKYKIYDKIQTNKQITENLVKQGKFVLFIS
jgi:hypothetical protein